MKQITRNKAFFIKDEHPLSESIEIVKRIVKKMSKTTKIESKVCLFEVLDILFLRSNAIRNHVIDNFDPVRHRDSV